MSEKNVIFKVHRYCYLLFLIILFVFNVCVIAAPHHGDEFRLKQPDGSYVQVRVWGDEYYQRIESIDGYSLIRNEYGWICYADLSAGGDDFAATDIVYEGTELEQRPEVGHYLKQNRGIKKKLKINRAARKAKALKNRQSLIGLQTPEMAAAADHGAGVEPGLSTAPAPLTGSVVGLTILVDFNDVPAEPTITPTVVDDYCNQVGYSGYSNNGSVYDYYYDVSNGLLEYTNSVQGYYRAIHDKSYYNDTSRPYGEGARELLEEALNWLDGQGYNFAQLSTEPDWANDERILAINLLYAGSPDVGWSEGLWPHASAFFGFTSSSGIKSGSYQITNIGTSLRLGTFCHENGHMICKFPDLYDYGYESHGIGDYGLMAGGGSSLNPVPPNPYLRDLKGWETIIEINNDASGTLRTLTANAFTTYRYSHPTNPKEFFLIESRLQNGRNDSLPDEGMLIWHIDEDGSNNNEQMTSDLHYLVSVEQADGDFDLENNNNYGDGSDLFHAGGQDAFNDTTVPDATWWDGSNSGLDISGIGPAGATMSFSVNPQLSYPPVATGDHVTVTEPNGIVIQLSASDDGLPADPGKLSYIITSLPEHGWLFDPNDSMEIDTIPYTLPNDANFVIYEPCPYYFDGIDNFSFKANDGGVAPDGGDSNIADVNMVMNMLSDIIYEVHPEEYRDYIPFMTAFKKVRTQTLYRAGELNSSPQKISSLSLFIETPPAIEIQNWTIRMKHSTLTEYASNAQFDNDGWTVVYDANEMVTETGWHEFPLQTAFDYNGLDSLLIDFSFENTSTNSSYGYVYDSLTGAQYRMISYWSNSGDPLTFTSPNIRWKRLFNVIFKTQPDTEVLLSDFNYNCFVGTEDLMTMVDTWLLESGQTGFNSSCDINTDNKVNLADYAVLASEWMRVMP